MIRPAEQGEGSNFRNAGYGEENLEPAGEQNVGVDQLFDCGSDLVDLHRNLDIPAVC